MTTQKLEWLEDTPLQCGYYPNGKLRCTNTTKMMAIGTNGTNMYWFPICTDCYTANDEMYNWQVAYPFGTQEDDLQFSE